MLREEIFSHIFSLNWGLTSNTRTLTHCILAHGDLQPASSVHSMCSRCMWCARCLLHSKLVSKFFCPLLEQSFNSTIKDIMYGMRLMSTLYSSYSLQSVLINQCSMWVWMNPEYIVKFQYDWGSLTYIQNFMSSYEFRKTDSLLISGKA